MAQTWAAGIASDEIAPLFGLPDRESLYSAARAAAITGMVGRDVVTIADYFRLLRWMVPIAGRETLALSERPILCGGKALAYAQASLAGTLGDALRALAETYNLLHGGPYNRVARGDGRLTFTVCDSGFPYTDPNDPRLPFVLECNLLGVHAAACELVGADLSKRLRAVNSRRPLRGGVGAAALDVWPVSVTVARDAYGLAYDEAVADLPVREAFRHGDQPLAVHERILRLIEIPRAAPASTREAVHRLLDEAPARDQAAVAIRLGMSTAGMRRRLSEEETSFRELHQEVLKAHACARLGRAADLDELAEFLGFSDRRAFRRAFKSWTGLTPEGYRRRAFAAA